MSAVPIGEPQQQGDLTEFSFEQKVMPVSQALCLHHSTPPGDMGFSANKQPSAPEVVKWSLQLQITVVFFRWPSRHTCWQ